MINGTQFITALGAEGRIEFILFQLIDLFSWIWLAIERASSLARQADIIGALSTEALRGTVRSLHPSEYFILSFC